MLRPANEGFKVKSKIDFMEITETHQLSGGTPKKKDEKPLAAYTLIYFFAYQKEKCSFTNFYEFVFYFLVDGKVSLLG